jgi:hypothetical protein
MCARSADDSFLVHFLFDWSKVQPPGFRRSSEHEELMHCSFVRSLDVCLDRVLSVDSKTTPGRGARGASSYGSNRPKPPQFPQLLNRLGSEFEANALVSHLKNRNPSFHTHRERQSFAHAILMLFDGRDRGLGDNGTKCGAPHFVPNDSGTPMTSLVSRRSATYRPIIVADRFGSTG